MNFLQVIAKSLGQLKVDLEKVKQREEELRRQYPHAEITIKDGTVKAQVKEDEDGVHCMYCGAIMVRRTNQYVKNGQWVQKKRKDNMSNWECPKCRPLCGGMPLATWYDDCYFPVNEEELKAKAQQIPVNVGILPHMKTVQIRGAKK